MTLEEFLRARIAEDEREARSCYNGVGALPRQALTLRLANADNVVVWNPARVLADCEAKRGIIRYHSFMLQAWEDKPGGACPDMTRRERHTSRLTLEKLAEPYANHPEYQHEEWTP